MIWVYQQIQNISKDKTYAYDTFEVGYYTPGGKWVPDGEQHKTREAAAERVHFLNGGNYGMVTGLQDLSDIEERIVTRLKKILTAREAC